MFIKLKNAKNTKQQNTKHRLSTAIAIMWLWGGITVRSDHPVSFSDKRIVMQCN